MIGHRLEIRRGGFQYYGECECGWECGWPKALGVRFDNQSERYTRPLYSPDDVSDLHQIHVGKCLSRKGRRRGNRKVT